MNIQSPTFTDYYIPYYALRSFPSIEKVARYLLNSALDGQKVRVYKSKSVARAIAKRETDSDGFSECFTISVSNPNCWGIFVKSDKDHCGVRISNKVEQFLDIQ